MGCVKLVTLTLSYDTPEEVELRLHSGQSDPHWPERDSAHVQRRYLWIAARAGMDGDDARLCLANAPYPRDRSLRSFASIVRCVFNLFYNFRKERNQKKKYARLSV